MAEPPYAAGVDALYFAFGSNMSRARLVERVGEVEVVGASRVAGWRHRFNKLGRDGTGKGNIERGDEHTWGVVYRVRLEQLARLDAYEGGYRRTALTARVGEGLVEVATYVGLRPGPSLAPADWYLEHYRQGIREHGLPDAWLAEVERHAKLR